MNFYLKYFEYYSDVSFRLDAYHNKQIVFSKVFLQSKSKPCNEIPGKLISDKFEIGTIVGIALLVLSNLGLKYSVVH